MTRILAILFLTISVLSGAEAPLNVITYNIRNDTAGDKGPRDWQGRKDKVAAYLLSHQTDIIGLQEVKHNQLLDMIKALPGYAHVGVGRDVVFLENELDAVGNRLQQAERTDAIRAQAGAKGLVFGTPQAPQK